MDLIVRIPFTKKTSLLKCFLTGLFHFEMSWCFVFLLFFQNFFLFIKFFICNFSFC